MAHADSKELLCSQALSLLGEQTIDSFDDENDRARTCALLYDTIVESLLSGYSWRFLMKKKRLSRLVEVPVNEYKYFYQLPSEIVGAPFAVFNVGVVNAHPVQNFEIFQGKLASSEEEVYLDFRIRPTEAEWPPYFVMLVVYAMAAHLAEPITDDSSKGDKWQIIAFGGPTEDGKGGYHRTARGLDAQQQPPQAPENFELITARMGGGA